MRYSVRDTTPIQFCVYMTEPPKQYGTLHGCPPLVGRRGRTTRHMSKSKSMAKPRTAVVLAAGSPSATLGAIFRHSSSAMVPINGRPIIHWLLHYLRHEGITRVILGLRHTE